MNLLRVSRDAREEEEASRGDDGNVERQVASLYTKELDEGPRVHLVHVISVLTKVKMP